MQSVIFCLATLSTLASGSPILNTRGVAPSFNLRAPSNPNAPEPVAALRGGIWHLGELDGKAVLFSDNSKESLFYEYGSNAGPSIGTANEGINITPGGSATVPALLPIQLVANNGTMNVKIEKDASGIPKLAFENGRFQACADTEGQTDGFSLIYVQQGQRDVASCARVDLISACSGSGTGASGLGQLGTPHQVDCQPN